MLATSPFLLLPNGPRRQVIRAALYATARQTPPEALRALLQIDTDLSGLIDLTAMDYDGGVHPKHRLTGYHDFFVERVRPGERVLDLGCGYGAVSYSLASKSRAFVTGLDLSAENIAAAQARFRHPNLRFVVGDATRDLPGDSVDVIVASNVLEHIEDRRDFLRTVQGRLHPSRWLIRVPMLNRDWRVLLRKELGLRHFSDPTHCTEYTSDTFAAEMRAASLLIVHEQINWGEIWAEVRDHA